MTAAGTIGAASQADAALLLLAGLRSRLFPARRRRLSRGASATRESNRPARAKRAEKETGAKPQGPLIIAVSIDKQKVRIYDAKGLFAESPVSTGMKGHSTPMGVFSIIQKHKFHHSNIYSGAPMPYMQRITWSGVAMHAGVLPGYPASHGCIRMPMAFADEDVELDQDGRARHRHARRDDARQFLASVAGGAEGRAAAGRSPMRSRTICPRPTCRR